MDVMAGGVDSTTQDGENLGPAWSQAESRGSGTCAGSPQWRKHSLCQALVASVPAARTPRESRLVTDGSADVGPAPACPQAWSARRGGRGLHSITPPGEPVSAPVRCPSDHPCCWRPSRSIRTKEQDERNRVLKITEE